jgi:microcystin degradation protein MlrC
MRIFVAGFQHETNTFAPSRADWPAFESGSAFPAFSHGHAMLDRLGGTSLPMGGFIREARRRGWTLLPSAWAGASPSAHLTREAFERIADHIVADARKGGFDAVYLDLHGAAVAEHVDDAEGELLQRLRAVIGPVMPLVTSLDLHANVTRRMLQHASAMSAYRTYPHVDGADTGARCAGLLAELWAHGRPWATHPVRLPFLLPLNAQCTMMDPARGVYARMAELDERSGVRLSFAMGFPAADFDECGPVIFGHGADAEAVHKAVQRVANEVMELRRDWSLDLLSPADAVQRALALAGASDKPVVIADTQDNPGAGADSNTTGLLHALRAAGAGRRFPGQVALGLLYDPEAARIAHAAGIGAEIDLAVGKAVRCFDGQLSDPPVRGRFKVLSLSDGVVPMHGPMTAGGTAHLGPSAGLELEGIRINVVSGQCQMLDLDLFRFLGVEPERMKLLVNKSSVHFRAAFAPIAAHILVAVAPGPMAANPAALPWTRLPPDLALHP